MPTQALPTRSKRVWNADETNAAGNQKSAKEFRVDEETYIIIAGRHLHNNSRSWRDLSFQLKKCFGWDGWTGNAMGMKYQAMLDSSSRDYDEHMAIHAWDREDPRVVEIVAEIEAGKPMWEDSAGANMRNAEEENEARLEAEVEHDDNVESILQFCQPSRLCGIFLGLAGPTFLRLDENDLPLRPEDIMPGMPRTISIADAMKRNNPVVMVNSENREYLAAAEWWCCQQKWEEQQASMEE